MTKQSSQTVVLTVGHSTRPLAGFIALLAAHPVTRLIDVRTVPRSRHNPQFNLEYTHYVERLYNAAETLAPGHVQKEAPGLAHSH